MKRAIKAPQALVAEAQQIMTGSYHTSMWAPGPEPLQILDVGACFGGYTVWACEMFPNAHVTAVEPNADMVEMMRENLDQFGYTDRVNIIEAALGDRKGIAEMHYGVNPGCTTTTPDGPMAGRVKDKIKDVPLEDASKLPTTFDMVKVDTEGAEVEILGALDLTDTRLVAYEFHRARDRVALEAMMRTRGFTLVRGWLMEPDTGTMIWLREVA